MKTFGQYISERDTKDDDEREAARHAKVKHREQETHDRLLATGGKEGEEAEKSRHRASKKGEQQRRISSSNRGRLQYQNLK